MSAAALSVLLALVGQFESAESTAPAEPAAETAAEETQLTLEDLGIEEGKLPEPRDYHEINDDLRAAMRAEALSESLEERAEQIHKLCALHVEIVSDPRFADSDYLKRLRGLIYSRLIRVKDDLKHDIAREREAAESTPAASPGETRAEDAPELAGTQGGGAVPDDGEALVELIETVISPASWDVNGGNGSIVYWANGHALVVRASGEVHHQLGGLIDGLRAAGN